METPVRIVELERKFAENPRRFFAALANEYRKNGELDRAIEMCEGHLAEQRNHLSGHVVLAQALVDAGRDTDAWDPLHTALDLDPENIIALRLLGELSARTGDAEQARGYFFRALEIEPRNEQILDGLKALSSRRADPPVPEPAAPAPIGDFELLEPFGTGQVAFELPREQTLAEGAEAAAEPMAEPVTADAEPLADPVEPGAPATEAAAVDQDMWGNLQLASEPDAFNSEAAGEITGETAQFVEPGEPTAEPAALTENQWADEPAAPEPVANQWADEPAAPPPVANEWPEDPASTRPATDQPADAPAEPALEVDGEDVWTGWDAAAWSGAEEMSADPQATQPPAEDRSGAWGLSDEWASPPAHAREPAEPAPPQLEGAAGAEDTLAESEPEAGHAEEPTERAESRPTLVSETMVELYLAQGHTQFAIEALRELLESRPDDERLRLRLAELERAAAPEPRETVRDLFARLGRGRSRSAQAAAALADAFHETPEESGPVAAIFGRAGSLQVSDDPALVAVLDDSPTDVPDAAAFEGWLRELRGS